jgi:hypothetical protein
MVRYLIQIIAFLIALTCFVSAVIAKPEDESEFKIDIAEFEAMIKSSRKVERSGDRLRLFLDDGRVKEYVGNRGACRDGSQGCLHYLYKAYLIEIKSFLIEVHCYEFCMDVLLVNSATGEVLMLEAHPNLSPSKERFAVVAASDAVALSTSAIQIFDIDNQRAARVFEFNPQQGYQSWSFRGWEGNDVLLLDVHVNAEGCGMHRKITIRVVKRNGAWGFAQETPCLELFNSKYSE